MCVCLYSCYVDTDPCEVNSFGDEKCVNKKQERHTSGKCCKSVTLFI